MYKEIKEQALKLLEEECPDEVKIYTRWERCIKMYTEGFRSVPQTLEEVLDWYNNCDPFDRGYRRGRLSVPLHFANHAIHAGACRSFVDYFLNAMCEPPLYVIIELLFQLNPYTEAQRLEMAKLDFMKRKTAEEPEYYLGYYGIDDETLRQWESESPEVPPTRRRIIKQTEVNSERLPLKDCPGCIRMNREPITTSVRRQNFTTKAASLLSEQ